VAEAVGCSEPTARKVFAALAGEVKAEADLFGNAPVQTRTPSPEAATLPQAPTAPARSRAGRKSWKPDRFDREKVSVLIAAGMTVEQIAKVLGKAPPTIRRHFREEIETGALKKEAELIEFQYRAAKKGSVAAQNAMFDRLKRARAKEAAADFASRQAPPDAPADGPSPPRPPAHPIIPSAKIGKKEEKKQKAFDAMHDPSWGGDLVPRTMGGGPPTTETVQ